MSKKRSRPKKNPQASSARRKIKARREDLCNYILIAILMDLALYSVYIQIIHHP